MIDPINGAAEMLKRLGLHAVMDAVKTLSAEIKDLGRTGGVLAIAVIREGKASYLSSTSIGEAPDLKIAGWAFNAHEKIKRLKEQRAGGKADIASSESADNRTKWGGCVVFPEPEVGVETYISFSGAKPEVDEAIAYAIGIQLGAEPTGYKNPLVERALELLEEM